MANRRFIFCLSVAIALAMFASLLAFAPHITLIESDLLAARAATRFRVEFLELPTAPPMREDGEPRRDLGAEGVELLLRHAQEAMTLPDALETPPVETPEMAKRVAGDIPERAYDLTPAENAFRQIDARILEISRETARRDIDIARRLVRPGPEFTLPEAALPALRSRDIGAEDIALEPVRFGAGLLVEALPPDGDPQATSPESPPFEPDVFRVIDSAEETALPALERTVVDAPVTREAQKAREESDYVFMDDLVAIHLDTYLPSSGDPGYFRLRITPRADAVMTPTPKDVVFIVDASRSMQQRKLDLVGRGIADAIATFRPDDRFNILLFRDTVTAFHTEPVPASPEHIARAQQFLGNIEARGQTDVYNALLNIAGMEPRAGAAGTILMASDGRPTTGLRDSRAIINSVTADNALRNTVYAYGAGSTANRYLLDLLAYRNKGEAFVSGRIEDARADVAAFVMRIADPILLNLTADYGRVERAQIFPQTLPDFYRGRPITVYGRFDPQRDRAFVARITGHAGNEARELLFRADLATAEQSGTEIAQGWAFQKAYHLIGEISRQGETPQMLDELQTLSHIYNIRTIYDEQ